MLARVSRVVAEMGESRFTRIPRETVGRAALLEFDCVGRRRAEDGREVDVEAAELRPCAREVGRVRVGDRIAVSGRVAPVGTLASVVEIADAGKRRKLWAVADAPIPYGGTLNESLPSHRG